MLNITPVTTVLPPELWMKIIDHLRRAPLPWMQSSSCCGTTCAPGSSLGVVQQSIVPDKELIPLAATCKLFHDMLADELQYTSLYVCFHPDTGRLVTHNGGKYPSGPSGSEGMIFTDIDYSAFASVRRLDLSLYEPGSFLGLDEIFQGAVPICDAVARDILPRTQNVVALSVHLRIGSSGNSIPLSAGLARAIGSLQQLAEISFSGCHLPLIPDLRLDPVVRMQTNKTISSFDPFPALKELRNDQWWLDQEGYRISMEAFARLEILHFCQSDSIEESQWFAEDCKVSSCRAVMELRTRVEPRLIICGRRFDNTYPARRSHHDYASSSCDLI